MREIEQRISRASAAVAGIIIRHALKTRREIPTGRQRRKKFQDREEGNKRRRGLSRFPPRRVFVLRITYPPRSSGGGGGVPLMYIWPWRSGRWGNLSQPLKSVRDFFASGWRMANFGYMVLCLLVKICCSLTVYLELTNILAWIKSGFMIWTSFDKRNKLADVFMTLLLSTMKDCSENIFEKSINKIIL